MKEGWRMNSRVSVRKYYLDILRILAAFLVCYNHSHAFHLYLTQEPSGGIMSWVNIFLPALTTVNIPLFFMISGALLMSKEVSYKTLFTKRIGRFLVLLFSASLVTYTVTHTENFSVAQFLDALLKGDVTISYWYLYAYLAFLAALPFLRKIALHLTHKDILFLILVRFLFGSVLMLINFGLKYQGMNVRSISYYLQFPFVNVECMFYPILGYYLAEVFPMEKVKGKHILLCVLLLLGGSAVSSAVTYLEGVRFGFTQTYIGLFNYTSALCVFLIVRYFSEKITLSETICAHLASVSSVTIGIYLFEPIVSFYLMERFYGYVYWHPIPVTVWSVLWCIVCMALGGTATYILRKIPVVKKYL